MTEQRSLIRFTRTAESAANQVIRVYSTSFGLACRLLGSRHRQHIRNIYALVRIADEIVDGLTAEAGLTLEQQTQTLDNFVAQTQRALRLGCSSDLVIHAFARTAQACGIDSAILAPFFDSMRTDLDNQVTRETQLTRFDSQAHAQYVYGSAEVVGLMCLRVFLRGQQPTERETAQLEHGAKQLGAAFQNINFLRDLADDTARLGRSYLGTSDRLDDYDRNEWIRTIRAQLDSAEAVIVLLPHDTRAAIRSAHALFTALTNRIDKMPTEALYVRRVRVPNPVKAGLAIRALVTTLLEPRK